VAAQGSSPGLGVFKSVLKMGQQPGVGRFAMDTSCERSTAVRSEQIKLLYTNSSFAFTAIVLNALILVFIEWGVVSHTALLAWLFYILALTLVRVVSVRGFYRLSPSTLEINRWGTLFLVGTAFSGVGWGAAGIWLFPDNSIVHQVFVAFVLGGMTAGAVATLSSMMAAFLSFAIPALLPVTVRFLAQGGALSTAMGWMVALYMILIVFIAWKLHETILMSLHLRLENREMIASLTAGKAQMEKLNTELTAEVAERTRSAEALRQSQEQLQETLVQLRALAAHLQSIREEERTRIAREVHDELGQALTGLQLGLSWLAGRLTPEQRQVQEKVKALSALVDTTAQAVRRISTELRPSVLDDLGLIAALEWLASAFTSNTGIRCEFVSDFEAVELNPTTGTAIFRIAQETLTNVIRHAEATTVAITLKKMGPALVLIVQDNGKGIDENKISVPRSLGLLGMREHARMCGGDVSFSGHPGRGTTVTLQIPLSPPA